MKKILIIKTSSLGDIIQAFAVLEYLKEKFPGYEIDWVVETTYASLLKSHPLINKVIEFDFKDIKCNIFCQKSFKSLLKSIKEVKSKRYDIIFDLQGNCKSGGITFCSKGKEKIGFGFKTVREWPNVLLTKKRFTPPQECNITQYYIKLVQEYFNDDSIYHPLPRLLVLDTIKQKKLADIYKVIFANSKDAFLIAPHSSRKSKALPFAFLLTFLQAISSKAGFIFVSGDEEEKQFNEKMGVHFPSFYNLHKADLAVLQSLMRHFKGVIAVDSAILHLAALAGVPTFSFFGPSSAEIYAPCNEQHAHVQGKCPYNISVKRVCNKIRSCEGGCLKNISLEVICKKFNTWQT